MNDRLIDYKPRWEEDLTTRKDGTLKTGRQVWKYKLIGVWADPGRALYRDVKTIKMIELVWNINLPNNISPSGMDLKSVCSVSCEIQEFIFET